MKNIGLFHQDWRQHRQKITFRCPMSQRSCEREMNSDSPHIAAYCHPFSKRKGIRKRRAVVGLCVDIDRYTLGG
ncbi:hypothetical protein J6590_058983 [Homalodisca vitripennis]|nr:hypothetical protein J6590_058983 [Homalodisca vitripennis]